MCRTFKTTWCDHLTYLDYSSLLINGFTSRFLWFPLGFIHNSGLKELSDLGWGWRFCTRCPTRYKVKVLVMTFVKENWVEISGDTRCLCCHSQANPVLAQAWFAWELLGIWFPGSCPAAFSLAPAAAPKGCRWPTGPTSSLWKSPGSIEHLGRCPRCWCKARLWAKDAVLAAMLC